MELMKEGKIGAHYTYIYYAITFFSELVVIGTFPHYENSLAFA